jgi:SAM-dependent methyltransferase
VGDVNQLTYLKRFVPTTEGPVLEVGSRDYGSTSSFREFYGDCRYVGVDMQAGPGVDLVVDLTESVGPLHPGEFGLIVCCSVLEHVRRPWVFADRLTSLLKEGGKLYLAVPWVWRYHPYPDDYFRFSWRGVMELFPSLEWAHVHYSTNRPGDFFEVAPQSANVDDQLARVADGRKYLPYLMVHMIGRKRLST